MDMAPFGGAARSSRGATSIRGAYSIRRSRTSRWDTRANRALVQTLQNRSSDLNLNATKPNMYLSQLLRAITSSYPLNTPRASLLSCLPAIPPHYGPFQGKHGIRYYGYWSTDDEVSRSLFWFGDFDPSGKLYPYQACQARFSCNRRRRQYRSHNTTISQNRRTSGARNLLEPIPANAEYLRQNIKLNGLSWVQIERIALSDKRGELAMHFAKDHAGMARVTGSLSTENIQNVPCVRFDDWLATQDRLDISVCKIDVEGHEAEVFSGMTKTLSERSIPAFVFERHADTSTNADPTFKLLQRVGYRVLQIRKGLLRQLLC